MLLMHITAGLLALLAGGIALFVRKGESWHRRSGLVFAFAMLAMTASGALMAAWKWERISMLAAALTAYLVCTGLLTVRRSVQESRALHTLLMLFGLATALMGYVFGLDVLATAKVPGWSALFFAFASFALLGALSDLRLLRSGSIAGPARLARHLWRMGLALWIATMSFFLGQARHFPQPLRESGALALPVLVVALMVLYWLLRLLWPRRAATPAARVAIVASAGNKGILPAMRQ